MKLWGGRFGGSEEAAVGAEEAERAAAFGRSIDVDAELALEDLDGSIAHVRGLGRAGLLDDGEAATLVAGLESLRRDVENGELAWDPALEDVHLNLEVALAERVGPVAGRLHTGRSRNDQVATDLRLWTRRAVDRLDAGLARVRARARRPGRARGRRGAARARPTSSPPSRSCSRHHLLAYVEMARARPRPARRRAAAARTSRRSGPARSPAPATRSTARRRPRSSGSTASRRTRSMRSATATSSWRRWRLSRSGWSTSAGSPRRSPGGRTRASGSSGSPTPISTGSSMMPNKRNPDPAELVRGRIGRGRSPR